MPGNSYGSTIKILGHLCKNIQLENSQIIVSELEKIEKNFYTSYESARGYLDSRKDDASSVISDTLSTDLHEGTNIQNHDTLETNRKENRLKNSIYRTGNYLR